MICLPNSNPSDTKHYSRVCEGPPVLKMNHQFASEMKSRLIQVSSVAKNTLWRMLHQKTESEQKPTEKHGGCYDRPTKILLKINIGNRV